MIQVSRGCEARRGPRAVLACVLVALVAFGGYGRRALAADGGAGAGAGVGTELRIDVAHTADDELAADIATAGVTVDVYLFAGADGLVAPFEGLEDALTSAQTGEGDWQALVEDAVALVAEGGATRLSPEDGFVADAEGIISVTLDDGMYLVVPREASGEKYVYEYQAALVQLPEQTEVALKFEAEPVDEPTPPEPEPPAPEPEPEPEPPRGVVRTGDDLRLMPFYVAMVVSGALLVALVVQGRRERRSGGDAQR